MILHTTAGSISVAARPVNHHGAWSSLPTDSLSGQGVTPASALALAAVFGAVSLIADANGIMPLEIIDQRAATGRRVVEAGWLPAMLQHEPNDDMSGVDVWTFVNACLLLRGNAYLAKIRNADGTLQLYPMLPDTVTPFRGVGGRKTFRVRVFEGETYVDADYTADAILHIKGRSLTDPLVGSSPISCARHALGTQLAQQEYQARAYSDGMLIKGVLSTPSPNLTPEAAERIKLQWRSAYGGLGNSHDVAVLHSGTTFQGVSMSPEDAQFIQTMKWGHTQIATLYKIPASRLNGDSGSSMRYANVAQDDLYMDKQACLPLRRQIEAALNRDLDMFGARSAWVPKFNPAVALQADLETRTRVADMRLRNGSISVNEYRTLEDEPTIGAQGDVYAASAPVASNGGGTGGPAAA